MFVRAMVLKKYIKIGWLDTYVLWD